MILKVFLILANYVAIDIYFNWGCKHKKVAIVI